MGRNRRLRKDSEEAIRRAFMPTIPVVLASVGSKAFRIKVKLANLREDGNEELVGDTEFRTATERSTADEEVAKARIDRALAAFAQLT